MVWFKPAEDGDMGGFFEVPELETGKFIDYDGVGGQIVEDVEGGNTDIADEVRILVEGLEKRMNE